MMKQKVFAWVLAIALCLSLAYPIYAADSYTADGTTATIALSPNELTQSETAQTFDLTVTVSPSCDVKVFEATLTLPDGITYVSAVSPIGAITYNNNMLNAYNAYPVADTSTVVTITLQLAANAAAGDYAIGVLLSIGKTDDFFIDEEDLTTTLTVTEAATPEDAPSFTMSYDSALVKTANEADIPDALVGTAFDLDFYLSSDKDCNVEAFDAYFTVDPAVVSLAATDITPVLNGATVLDTNSGLHVQYREDSEAGTGKVAFATDTPVKVATLSITIADDGTLKYGDTVSFGFAGTISVVGTENTPFEAAVTLETYAVEIVNTATVSFDANGHGTAPAAQTVNYRATATEPARPTAAGYSFGGWYTEAACENAFDFGTEITEDITLYAKWSPVPAGAPTVTVDDLGLTYSYTVDATTVLTATVEGADTDTYTYSYKWYRGATATGTVLGTEATLRIEAGLSVGDYPYTCVVTATRIDNGETADGSATGTVSVAPKAVTVKADAKTKVYGDTDPTLTATVTGLVEGESEDLIQYTLSRAEGVNVGEYTITPSGDAAQGNYTVTYETDKLTITQAAVTVKANNAEKTIGEDDPALTVTITGLKNNDPESVITYTVSRGVGENVGTYVITPTGAASQGNYTVTYETGTFLIKPFAYTLEDHRYATAGSMMIRIENKDGKSVKFSDVTMAYTEDENYQINGNGVSFWLIPAADIETVDGTPKLKDASVSKFEFTDEDAPAEFFQEANAGDVNKDGRVNVVDANAVYQLLQKQGVYDAVGNFTVEMRLLCDVHRGTGGTSESYRGSLLDVTDILAIVNAE